MRVRNRGVSRDAIVLLYSLLPVMQVEDSNYMGAVTIIAEELVS